MLCRAASSCRVWALARLDHGRAEGKRPGTFIGGGKTALGQREAATGVHLSRHPKISHSWSSSVFSLESPEGRTSQAIGPCSGGGDRTPAVSHGRVRRHPSAAARGLPLVKRAACTMYARRSIYHTHAHTHTCRVRMRVPSSGHGLQGLCAITDDAVLDRLGRQPCADPRHDLHLSQAD